MKKYFLLKLIILFSLVLYTCKDVNHTMKNIDSFQDSSITQDEYPEKIEINMKYRSLDYNICNTLSNHPLRYYNYGGGYWTFDAPQDQLTDDLNLKKGDALYSQTPDFIKTRNIAYVINSNEATLYIDANGDNKISMDKEKLTAITKTLSRAEFIVPLVKTIDDQDYDMLITANTGHRYSWHPACIYEGEFQLNNKNYHFVCWDDNVNGKFFEFNQDVYAILSDEEYNGTNPVRKITFGENINLGKDIFYNVHLENKKIVLEKNKSQLGDLNIEFVGDKSKPSSQKDKIFFNNFYFINMNQEEIPFNVDFKNEYRIKLPEGKYKISNGTISVFQNPESSTTFVENSWIYNIQNTEKSINFEIKKDKPFELKLIKPKLTVDVSSKTSDAGDYLSRFNNSLIYQSVELEGGKTYLLEGNIKDYGGLDFWAEFYLSPNAPTRGADYLSGTLSALKQKTWQGIDKYEGKLTSALPSKSKPFTVPGEGLQNYYFVLKAGCLGNGNIDIIVDDLALKEIISTSGESVSYGQNLLKNGDFGKDTDWNEIADLGSNKTTEFNYNYIDASSIDKSNAKLRLFAQNPVAKAIEIDAQTQEYDVPQGTVIYIKPILKDENQIEYRNVLNKSMEVRPHIEIYNLKGDKVVSEDIQQYNIEYQWDTKDIEKGEYKVIISQETGPLAGMIAGKTMITIK